MDKGSVQGNLFSQGNLFGQKLSDPEVILSTTSMADFKREFLARGCVKCDLHESCTQIVISRGNPQSRIMIIGEGPGAEEDQQGKPFCGKSGQLMDRLFQEIGFNTDRDTYVTNVVKCRPPENRTPNKKEVESCKPYLLKEIEFVKPKVILCMGMTSAKHLVRLDSQTKMGEIAGKFFQPPEFPGVTFMILYHPAALLYTPSLTKPMKEHLRALKKFLETTAL
ncbi:MAG: uracil-DNA glycosylase [Candidatus Tectomicrobia bacterium]|nr:uracil-DNA glycosylase [Candidatus Tectomicrobia bacterium]